MLQNPIGQKIIGPKGTVIAEIQTKSGCTVKVGIFNTVTFVGTEKQIRAAETLVQAIERQNKNFPPSNLSRKAKFMAEFPPLSAVPYV